MQNNMLNGSGNILGDLRKKHEALLSFLSENIHGSQQSSLCIYYCKEYHFKADYEFKYSKYVFSWIMKLIEKYDKSNKFLIKEDLSNNNKISLKFSFEKSKDLNSSVMIS